jgi:D-aspartate ligase
MATMIEYPAPVVMLRSARHGGLGIARSLGRMGIPVYSVDNDELAPAHTSRYCRNHYLLDIENAPPGRGIEDLLAIGRKLGGKPILIPTTDTATIWVADHAETLRPIFRFPHQEATLVRTLCDKGTMRELARKNGVPVAGQAVPAVRALPSS